MAMSPIHFYLTFNPYLNKSSTPDYTQAHEFNDLLREIVSKDSKGSAYWGKIIGIDRTSKVDIAKFEKALAHNLELGASTHLYITDFQNLWVAKVASVNNSLPKKGRTLDFYTDKNVEIWFEIQDFCLLEFTHDETAAKLSELYIDNEFMDLTINELSPFTTAVRYPCFIQDLAEEQFFDELDTEETSHLVLRPHPGINNNSIHNVLRCIHTYAFPESMYSKLPHAAKMEIESIEMDMLEQRHSNLGRVAFGYIKALEVVLNSLIAGHLKRSGNADEFFIDDSSNPPKIYFEMKHDRCVPMKKFNKNYSIGQLISLIERATKANHADFKQAFAKHKQFLRFVTGEFRQILEDNNIIAIRGLLAHNSSSDLTREDALAVRNIILGIGCTGLIQMCYQSFYPDEFKSMTNVQGNHDRNVLPDKSNLKLVG